MKLKKKNAAITDKGYSATMSQEVHTILSKLALLDDRTLGYIINKALKTYAENNKHLI